MKNNFSTKLQQILDVNTLQNHFRKINSEHYTFLPNIGPDEEAKIIYKTKKKHMISATFGLVPTFMQHYYNYSTIYNTRFARIETIHKNKFCGDLYTTHKAIIPVSGFYMWDFSTSVPTPYLYESKKEPILYLAGMYDTYAQNDLIRYSFNVLTYEVSSITKKGIPVIVESHKVDAWLDGEVDLYLEPKPKREDLKKRRVSRALAKPTIKSLDKLYRVS